MLEIYKEERLISKDNKKLIKFIDLYFNSVGSSLDINKKDEEYMHLIDNAVYIGNSLIETPFGRTDISNLSTGCKTLILLNHYTTDSNMVISIVECGENAIKCIYSMNNVSVYSPYMNVPLRFDENKHVRIIRKNGTYNLTLQEAASKRWV